MSQKRKSSKTKNNARKPKQETAQKPRLIDAVSTAVPSALLFIGLIMLSIANPYGEYLIGAGVVLQLAFLIFRVPKLFNQNTSSQPQSDTKER